METACKPGKVNISQRTYARIQDDSNMVFEPRGKIGVKGKADIEMYFVQRKL